MKLLKCALNGAAVCVGHSFLSLSPQLCVMWCSMIETTLSVSQLKPSLLPLQSVKPGFPPSWTSIKKWRFLIWEATISLFGNTYIYWLKLLLKHTAKMILFLKSINFLQNYCSNHPVFFTFYLWTLAKAIEILHVTWLNRINMIKHFLSSSKINVPF